MGNTSSRYVQAILDIVSSSVVKINQSCLASARNSVLIDVLGASNVIVRNLNISQTADASISCQFTNNVSVASTVAGVERMLDDLIEQTNATGKTKSTGGAFNDSTDIVKVTNRIANSLTKDIVNTCLAEAVNDFRLQIKRTKGTVTIHDMDIFQLATAHVQKCIKTATVQISASETMPLPDYIDSMLANGTITMKKMNASNTSNTSNTIGMVAIGSVAGIATVAVGIAAILLPNRSINS